MNTTQRIRAFNALGDELREYLKNEETAFQEEIDAVIKRASVKNKWFIPRFSIQMFKEITAWLQEKEINNWLNKYKANGNFEKRVAIIAAGNIPMVAYHDYLCCLLSGYSVCLKLSSDDDILIPLLHKILSEVEPYFKDKVEFVENLRDQNFDAVIATGSNNSSRYFDYYFEKYPKIIRKNRNGIAVIKGDESDQEMQQLGADIFNYFGLGCRNVSKLFVPVNYDFDRLYKNVFDYSWVLDNQAYTDNYEYNKTVYLLNNEALLDNGFLLLKEDPGLSSPVGVLFWENYSSETKLKSRIEELAADTQCVIGSFGMTMGESQSPRLNDYADGVDTMAFLDNLLTAEVL